jgi:uncharacterized damage-inducible protein DinB
MKKPEIHTLPEFYQNYVREVPEVNLSEALENSKNLIHSYLSELAPEKAHFRYAEDKWTVMQVIQHCLDTEKIMANRALRIARGDQTLLPGFNQDEFVKEVDVSERTLADITEEYLAVRHANQLFFKSLKTEDFIRIGNANGSPISVIGLGFIIVGHERHHLKILKERYV